MLDPPHGLHLRLMRLCSKMLDPPHCLDAAMLADARSAAWLILAQSQDSAMLARA
jgi:hypothetical protein